MSSVLSPFARGKLIGTARPTIPSTGPRGCSSVTRVHNPIATGEAGSSQVQTYIATQELVSNLLTHTPPPIQWVLTVDLMHLIYTKTLK